MARTNSNLMKVTLAKVARFFTKFSGGSRISHRGGVDPLGGRGPATQVLFGKNVCKNERIGSRRRPCTGHAPPTSANEISSENIESSLVNCLLAYQAS